MLLFVFSFFFTLSASAQGFIYRTDSKVNRKWIREVKNNSNGLKVMFWNVGCFMPNQNTPHNEKPQKLMHNLKTLLKNNQLRPDVFIFGEHCKYPFEYFGVDRLLKRYYPHFKFERDRYNRFYERDNGMTIYSRYKMYDEEVVMMGSSNWMSHERMRSCERRIGHLVEDGANSFIPQSWRRPYLNFKVKAKGHTYNIGGIHLTNPFPLFKKCFGTVKTGLEILYGTHNPNYHQARVMTSHFANSNEKTLLIGDFNAIKNYSIKIGPFRINLDSKSYRHIKKFFGDSIIRSDMFTSFNNGVRASIDHAFANKKVRVLATNVVPLAGSDHLPIYVIIK